MATSIQGQWLGKYGEFNEGLAIVNIDLERPGVSMVCTLFDNEYDSIGICASFSLLDALPENERGASRVLIYPVDPVSGALTTWHKLAHLVDLNKVPSGALLEFIKTGHQLQLTCTLDIGTNVTVLLE